MSSIPCRQFVAPFVWQKLDDDLLPEPPNFPIGHLLVIVEWSRICQISGKEEKFIADRWCKYGFIGECTHCGEERIAPFTRTHAGGEG